MLFSVTLPPRILAIARRHLREPVEIKVARERVTAGQAPRVRQTAYVVSRAHKLAALGRVLDMESPESALVFCRTRDRGRRADREARTPAATAPRRCTAG